MHRRPTTACCAPAALALALAIQPVAAAPRDPSGPWLTEDGRARVRVETCGPARDRLCGYIVWLRPGAAAAALDRKNPDPRKSARPVLGHQLILGLKANEDDRYEGLIYNADDGKSYDVTVWLESANDLKVKGCLVAFLCSTQSWTRAPDPVQGQLVAPTGAPGGPRPDPEWASMSGPAPGRPASPAVPKRDTRPPS